MSDLYHVSSYAFDRKNNPMFGFDDGAKDLEEAKTRGQNRLDDIQDRLGAQDFGSIQIVIAKGKPR